MENTKATFVFGPRGFLSNYPPDVVAVCNGHPVTKADILERKRWRQAQQLRARRLVSGPVIRPAFVWVFFNEGWAFHGWHLYIHTLRQDFNLTGRYCGKQEIILKIMTTWPCGYYSPSIENLRNWLPAFAWYYQRATRKRPTKQGMVQCWARYEGDYLLDVLTNEEYSANFARGRIS